MQLQELNSRFNEASFELLLCVACLSPDNMFASFNKEKLIHLAQFYPNDFSAVQLITLDNQFETYIFDMRSSDEFATHKGIGQLDEKKCCISLGLFIDNIIIDSTRCDNNC